MKLELIQGRKAEERGFEVIDVTTVAAKMSAAVPGWRVQLTQQVWEQYVEMPEDCRSGEGVGSRLWDLCANLWIELRFAKHPTNWVLGGFDFGIGKLRWHIDSSTPRPERWQFPAVVRLDVAAVIARNGSPALLVFSPRDHYDHAAACEVE
jgi:hypothetical protein